MTFFHYGLLGLLLLLKFVDSVFGDTKSSLSESVMPNMLVIRPLSSQNGVKLYSSPVGHSKASQSSKEWKPKISQKPILNSPDVIDTSKKITSHLILDAKDGELEVDFNSTRNPAKGYQPGVSIKDFNLVNGTYSKFIHNTYRVI